MVIGQRLRPTRTATAEHNSKIQGHERQGKYKPPGDVCGVAVYKYFRPGTIRQGAEGACATPALAPSEAG